MSCGCGASCPLPGGHAGRYWAEHARLIHSHLTVPNAPPSSSTAHRWLVPLTVVVGLISLALAIGFSALPGL